MSEIKTQFDRGARNAMPRVTTVAHMTDVIRAQMDRGVYVSRHLRGGAVDIRTRDVAAEDLLSLKSIIMRHGGSVLREGDHLHVQFPAHR